MKKLFVLIAAVCLVGAFSVPVMAAADWNFYGSARMTTFVESKDPGTPNSDSDTDTTWTLQGNSRLGASVSNGDIGGGFEFGVKGDADANAIYTRKLFGTYTFGESQILVGQDYTPVSGMFYSNQVWGSDEDLLSFGQCYGGRRPMLRYKIDGFQFALVQPNAPNMANLTGDKDVILPRFEMKYTLTQETFFMDVYGGYQTYSVEVDKKDYDVDSFAVGIGGGLTLEQFFFKANVYYAQNGGQYGLAAKGVDDAYYDAGKDKIIDCDTLGGLALMGVIVNENLTFEAGAGAVRHEYDVDNAETDESLAAYVNCTINIAPGFFVVPEIGYIDYKEDHAKNEEGDMTYFGAKWQINF